MDSSPIEHAEQLHDLLFTTVVCRLRRKLDLERMYASVVPHDGKPAIANSRPAHDIEFRLEMIDSDEILVAVFVL